MADPQKLLAQIRTSLASADQDKVVICGRNLTQELMGHHSFVEVFFLMLKKRLPRPEEAQMCNAILLSLMDHGLMPNIITTRLTYHSGPEAIQGAVAAGVLGAGSRYLGTAENAAMLLQEAVTKHPDLNHAAEDDLRSLAHSLLAGMKQNGRRMPGIGHAVHPDFDPRAVRLMELAGEYGIAGPHCRLMEAIVAEAPGVYGRRLPLNVTGAMGATLSDLGLPWQIVRGFAILARTAGLIAHIAEELEAPIAGAVMELLASTSAPMQR